MWYRLLIATIAMVLLWTAGCGSAPRQPLVLIEPEYSYLRDEARLAAPLGQATARRAEAPGGARRELTAPLSRVP